MHLLLVGKADSHLLPVGRADSHLLPVGRADSHSLPPVLATKLGTIDWSSQFLRFSGISQKTTVGIADSGSANAQRGPGAVFVNPVFQRKNRFPAVFAPGNPLDFSKNL